MDKELWLKQKRLNNIQSLLLIIALMIILGILGNIIAGKIMAFSAILFVILLYFLNPVISPHLVLKSYHTREIAPYQAPNLYAALEFLAKRADLVAIPKLVYLPSDRINAFAVGSPANAVIALSDGILRRLSLKELIAVLAHEVSHIAHEDVRIMGFADMMSRLTNFLSITGQFLLILKLLLLLLFNTYVISWTTIFILIFAPIITDLLQLALSRTREYNADLGAAALLGDPEILASALLKIDGYQGNLLEQIFLPGYRSPEPSLFRSHPPTKQRVKRLLALRKRYVSDERVWQRLPLGIDIPLSLFMSRRPLPARWHFDGIRF
jgi:heat shock protein HtpX